MKQSFHTYVFEHIPQLFGWVIAVGLLVALALVLAVGAYVYSAVRSSRLEAQLPSTAMYTSVYQKFSNVVVNQLAPNLFSIHWRLPETTKLSAIISITLFNNENNLRLGSYPFTYSGLDVSLTVPSGYGIVVETDDGWTVNPAWQVITVVRH